MNISIFNHMLVIEDSNILFANKVTSTELCYGKDSLSRYSILKKSIVAGKDTKPAKDNLPLVRKVLK